MKKFGTLLFSSAFAVSLALPVVAQSNNTRLFVHTIPETAPGATCTNGPCTLWNQVTDPNTSIAGTAEPGWDFAAGDGHGGPYTCGLQMVVPWSLIESTQGTYDFSPIDTVINNLAGTGTYWKGLDITFESVGENTNNELHSSSTGNCQAGAHEVLDNGVYYCESTPGYVITNMLSSNETVFNGSNDPDTSHSCSRTTSLKGIPRTPDYLSSTFTNRWEAFIVAVLRHFANNPTLNAHLAALHFSIGSGEAAPIADPSQACIADLEGKVGAGVSQPITLSTWTTWATNLVDYVNSQVTTLGFANQVQIYWDLNGMGAFAQYENTTDNFMPTVAAEVNKWGMGIGNDGFGFAWDSDGVNNTSHTWLFEAANVNTTSGACPQGTPYCSAGTLNAALTHNQGAALWYAETASPGCQDDPPMTSPPVPTLTTGTGSLAAGTYYYEVDAINQYGEETVPNSTTEAHQTLTATGSVNVKLRTVKYATEYRIYRGTTSGGENGYFTVPSTTTTFTDDGTQQPTSGTPPTTYVACTDSFQAYQNGVFDQVLQLAKDPSSYTASFPTGYTWPISSPLGTNSVPTLHAYPQEWDIAYDSNTTNNPRWGATDRYNSSETYNQVYKNAIQSAGFSTSSCQVPYGKP